METTVMTSSIMGPIMLLLGIGLFINTKYYKNLATGIKENKGLIIITSIFGMILGSFMVANHNILDGAPEKIISIVGWIILLKSSLILALPKAFTKLASKVKYSSNTLKTVGLVYITIGLYLMNYAYYGV
ncbi:MAG: hypothetical protein QM490_04955 [Candidatus Gracilibacteria bacterium]